MPELELKLTLPEINTLLEALGSLPYKQVYQLVAKIQQQAQLQLQEGAPASGNVFPQPAQAQDE